MTERHPAPYHLRQLARICEDHPAATKVVFVPRRRIGHKLSTALARADRTWVNLHLTTPYEWAKKDVEPRLKREGWREMTAGADLLVLERLVRTSDLEVDLDPETLARAAAVTLPAMRLAGVSPDAVWSAEGPDGLKRLVENLAQRYAAFLRREKIYDEAEVFRRALRRIPDAPKADLVCAVLDEVELPGLAFEYVNAVAERSANAVRRIGRSGYGTDPPRLSAAERLSKVKMPVLSNGRFSVGVGGSLWNDEPDASGTGSVHTEQVLGVSNEVRAVLRRLQVDEIPYDHVELVYTSDGDYLQRIFSLFSQHDIPATYSGGLPVSVTRPGRALRLFYDWIETGFDPTVLVELFASGAVRSLHGIEPHRVATALREARPARGRDQYFAALDRLDRDSGHGEQATTFDADEIERIRSIFRLLFNYVPKKETSVADVVERTQEFLDVLPRRRSEVLVPGAAGDEDHVLLDDEAVETLVRRFRRLAELAGGRQPRARIVRQLRDQLARHKVADSSPRPGCIHVSDVRSAGYTNRPHLFVVGLHQAAFPGGSSEDPLLLDHMRREISSELPLRGNAPAEMNWHLARVLGMSTGRAALLCSRRDLVGDRPVHPSAAFLRADRLAATPNAGLALLPEPPDASIETDWLARRLLSESEVGMVLRGTDEWPELAGVRYPWLAEGRRAEVHRSSDRLTPFDGVLRDPDESLSLDGTTVSASWLETLATCPYRYLMRYVLNVQPVEELTERDSDRWLDAREFGSLLHRLFRRFMQRVARRGETVSREAHGSLMRELLDEEMERQSTRMPPPNQPARRRDEQRLWTSARIFLAAEEAYGADHEPAGFEVEFGRGPSGEDESGGSIGQEAPVDLELSDRVRLRLQGVIDRVDRGPDGRYAVWDYKTGSTHGFEAYDLFSQGEKLQWALYAQALAVLTDEPVARAGYFFPTERTYGRRMAQRTPEGRDIARFLEPLFDMVERGYFLQAASEDHCKYCDYREICGDYDRRGAEIKQKLDNESIDGDLKQLFQRWNYGG